MCECERVCVGVFQIMCTKNLENENFQRLWIESVAFVEAMRIEILRVCGGKANDIHFFSLATFCTKFQRGNHNIFLVESSEFWILGIFQGFEFDIDVFSALSNDRD